MAAQRLGEALAASFRFASASRRTGRLPHGTAPAEGWKVHAEGSAKQLKSLARGTGRDRLSEKFGNQGYFWKACAWKPARQDCLGSRLLARGLAVAELDTGRQVKEPATWTSWPDRPAGLERHGKRHKSSIAFSPVLGIELMEVLQSR